MVEGRLCPWGLSLAKMVQNKRALVLLFFFPLRVSTRCQYCYNLWGLAIDKNKLKEMARIKMAEAARAQKHIRSM